MMQLPSGLDVGGKLVPSLDSLIAGNYPLGMKFPVSQTLVQQILHGLEKLSFAQNSKANIPKLTELFKI